MTIQLEPVQMPGARGLDETEEERRAREAAEAYASDVTVDPIMPPPPQPPPSLGPDPAAPPEAAEAQRVGDAYRAAGAQPTPTSTRTHHVTNRSGRPMPPATVYSFDSPDQSLPSPAAPPPTPLRAAAPSLELGRRLGAPVVEAQPPSPPPAVAAPDVPPAIARRRELMQRIRERQGERAPDGQPVDHTGADVADAFRRPLHAIGSALRASAGQSPTAFRSIGDQSRERERQTIASETERRQQESRMRLAERREQRADETLESQQADRVARREDAAARTQSLDDYRQSMLAIRQRADEGLISQRQAAAESIRLRNERDQAANDPSSDLSAREREAFAQEIAIMPPALRQMIGHVDTSGMSSAQIDNLRPRLNQVGQLRHGAGTGRRRSGSGGARAQQGPPEWWSQSPEEWRAMTRSQRGAAIARNARESGEDDEAGVLIAPGVRSSMELRSSDANNIRQGLTSAASSAANLRGIGSIAERHGGMSARISPSARAEITPRLTVARGMVATLGQTGVINATEVPTINAALPNPADLEQMSFGTFNTRLQTWQSMLEERVRAELTVNGVDDAGVQAALRMIRGQRARAQSQQRPQAPAADRVRVRLPNGRQGTVPRSSVDRLPEGTEVLDG